MPALSEKTIERIKEEAKDNYKLTKKEVLNIDLRSRFEKFNELLFNNQVPNNFPLTWSNQLSSTAGKCERSRKTGEIKEIKMSVGYARKKPELINSVLVHEMIHASGIRGHMRDFKREMYRINKIMGKDFVTQKVKTFGKKKYAICCPECEKVLGYRNRLSQKIKKAICRKCHTQIEVVKLK
jgi:predicted SprT family Zn-dependent metalloprotease